MTDLPLHDATRDLLFMAETRTAEATLNKRLDRLRSEFPPRPAAPPSLPGLPAGRRHSDRALVARPACAVGTDARRACARARRLEVEQARSDDLLYSMLPRPVVEDLRDGRRARGAYEDMVRLRPRPKCRYERFRLLQRKRGCHGRRQASTSSRGRRGQVTILFADIVGFTNICAAVHPQRVVRSAPRPRLCPRPRPCSSLTVVARRSRGQHA
jgi:hypothetical protein